MNSGREGTHDRNAVVVNVGIFMKLFLDVCVFSLWPDEVKRSACDLSDLRRE